MSSSLTASLFAAAVGSIFVCELLVPYRKDFFYSLAAAGVLCCLLSAVGIELDRLCLILPISTGLAFVAVRSTKHLFSAKAGRKKEGVALSECLADGWILVYREGCVLLVPTDREDVRKGDVLPIVYSGKERVLYHGK